MADIAIFRINYKSDFILTLNSDAGWMTPFCIKFWTGAPSQAYFVGFDGTTYTHCAPVDGEPTKLLVQFDDHHLPIGDLKFQIGYHFTVADFPTSVEDEVLNQASVIIEVDDVPAQVMLDLNGETAPEIEFSLPAYANEAQRIANEEARIEAEQQRITNEDARIQAEEIRQYNEQQRIQHEEYRVSEFATLKSQSQAATSAANAAATLANEKAQLAADKAALAQAAATMANEKAQLAADKAALAQAAATLANEKATLAQQKAAYAQTQGDYAKAQGDYAKEQGEIAEEDHERAEADHTRAESDHTQATSDHTQAGTDHSTAVNDHTQSVTDHTQADTDHTRAESDHTQAASDHTQAGADHTRAESDHTTASADHTQAGQDHTRAESDHTRAESDHAAVEVYVDSLGAFDISAYHATGGVLAKYADLAAALGTNGANIPDALRKGGMSVKYVQSSDNKYVQYRLMSDSFNTAIANWQGVDNKPNANSSNIVESAGIFSRYDCLRKFHHFLDIETDITGKYYASGGNLVDAPYPAGFFAKEIDITGYANRYLCLRCGWVNQFAEGCFVKLSNDTYVTLKTTATLSFDGSFYIYKLPSNAVALQITYRIGPEEQCGYFVGFFDDSIISYIFGSTGAMYRGVAEPTNNPGTLNGNLFCLATQKGTYVNYGNTVIDDDGLYVLYWSSSTSWIVQRLFAYEDNAKYNSINPITSDAIYKHFNGLRAFLNFLDITMAQEPSGNGQYYSAGGVLSDALYPTFYNKAIDISSYAGKYLYIRCGWGDLPNPHWGNGCYVKLSDNTYISLAQQGVVKHSFTNEYDIYKLPYNAVELEITYCYSNLSANCYFVAIGDTSEEDLILKVKRAEGIMVDFSDAQSGYWSAGGTIGTPQVSDPFIAKAIDLTNYAGCSAKIRTAMNGLSGQHPDANRDNTGWGYVKFKDNTYKDLETLTVAVLDGEYSILNITEEMVELEVSVRIAVKPDYFVCICQENYISRKFFALGDSTTYGAGSGGTTSTNGHISWADRLVKKIGFKAYQKLAINSTLCFDDSTHPKLASQIAQVTDGSIVTVMIGTNDINLNVTLGDVPTVMAMDFTDLNDTTNFAMAFRYNMETLIRNCPHAIILCMMPISPLGTTLAGTGYLEPNLALRAKCEQYMDVERQICKYLSIPVVETMAECGITPFAQTQLLVTDDINSPSFMADNYHPNTAGNEKIANLMRSKIIQFCG